jgi:hypothetical protein
MVEKSFVRIFDERTIAVINNKLKSTNEFILKLSRIHFDDQQPSIKFYEKII